MKRQPLALEIIAEEKHGALRGDLYINGRWIFGTGINAKTEDEAATIMESIVATRLQYLFEDEVTL